MGTRSHYQENITDRKGNVLPGALVTIYDQGTTDLIGETIYAGDTGVATTLSNPVEADDNALFEIWLDAAARVDIVVEYGGKTDEPRTIDVTRTPNEGKHIVKDDGTAKTSRDAINFQDGFVLTDDAAGDETEIDLDYAGTSELTDIDSSAESAGTATKVARGDHKHAVANDAVAYAKIQNVSAASRLLGRGSAAGSGDVEEISLGTNLSMSGTTLSASGGGTDQFFLPAPSFFTNTGSPTLAELATNTEWAVWLFDGAIAVTEGASAAIVVPTGWTTADFHYYWTNAGAGSGDVRVRIDINHVADGADLSTGYTTPLSSVVAAPAQNVLKVTSATGISVTAGRLMLLAAFRLGADAGDTLSNDIGFIGIRVVKAS